MKHTHPSISTWKHHLLNALQLAHATQLQALQLTNGLSVLVQSFLEEKSFKTLHHRTRILKSRKGKLKTLLQSGLFAMSRYTYFLPKKLRSADKDREDLHESIFIWHLIYGKCPRSL